MNEQQYFDRNKSDDCIDPVTPYDNVVRMEEGDLNRNDYREAAQHFARIMTLALSFILEGGSEMQNRLLGVVYALNLLDLVDGKSQREIARELGISHGTISRNVQAFKNLANI